MFVPHHKQNIKPGTLAEKGKAHCGQAEAATGSLVQGKLQALRVGIFGRELTN
jgi:hypothetical protein